MSLNKIFAFFGITLPVCVVLRIVQILFMINFENGFYHKNLEIYGNAVMVIIFIAAAALVYFCLNAYQSPEKKLKSNLPIKALSLLFSAVLLLELAVEGYPDYISPWQVSLAEILNVAAIIYFLTLAFNLFQKFSLPNIIHIVPVIYLIYKIIINFINIATLALISDNILLLASYCTALVFFLEISKTYNDVTVDKTFRYVLASGLVAPLFCFTQSIAYFMVNIIRDNTYTHTDLISNLSLLVLGIFVLVSTFYYFKKKNKRYK